MKNKIIYLLFILLFTKISFGIEYKTGTISAPEIWKDTIHIIGNITVGQGGSVIIQPGCLIESQGKYYIKITQNGFIKAIGNQNQKITFTANLNKVDYWTGIRINNMSSDADSTIFEHCIISKSEGAIELKKFDKLKINFCSIENNKNSYYSSTSIIAAGITSDSSSLIINNSLFSNNSADYVSGGLFAKNSNIQILNSEFIKNGSYFHDGETCDFELSTVFIYNCIFEENGIESNTTKLTILNGKFFNCRYRPLYAYNSVNTSGYAKILNSIFTNNDESIKMADSIPVTIINTTVANNLRGGFYFDNNKNVKIFNSIIWNNVSELNYYSEIKYTNDPPMVNNCNIKNIEGLILPNSINNISQNPKFIAPSIKNGYSSDARTANWSLKDCSPSVNSGNNSFIDPLMVVDFNQNPRIYETTTDMGAFELQKNKISLGKKIVYVKIGETGDGSSWNNAIGDLQEALDLPLECYDTVEIWVAKGTYYPNPNGLYEPKDATFNLNGKNILYGGFKGDETSIHQRDLMSNTTILNGDFLMENNLSNNSYNVVTIKNIDNEVLIDGFTIKNGGKAISCINANLNCKNLTLVNNGSGIVVENAYSFKISNSKIANNSYTGLSVKTKNNKIFNTKSFNNGGSGIYLSGKSTIANCIISNNNYNGIEIYSDSTSYIINSIIANIPSSHSYSAGIKTGYNTKINIYNSIFENNSNKWLNEISHIVSGYSSEMLPQIKIYNSYLEGGKPINILDSNYINNIEITNPRFVSQNYDLGVSPHAININWNLNPCSPLINSGNNAIYNATLPLLDLNNNYRIYDGTIDIGPYEYEGTPISLSSKQIIYVKQNATGDGSSWVNAIGDLQKAIDLSANCYDTTEIWVAKGTYIPYTLASLEYNYTTFNVRNKTLIYGGFNGDETSLNQRNWIINETILKGNKEFLNSSYNIQGGLLVTILNQKDKIVIDGFTIENGFNSFNYFYLNIKIKKENEDIYFAGGINCINSIASIQNCCFRGNSSLSGSALLIYNSTSNVLNCKFENNYFGSSLRLESLKGNIVNCTFDNRYGNSYNSRKLYGILSNNSKYNITNCTFYDRNRDTSYAIRTNDTLTITNSIIWSESSINSKFKPLIITNNINNLKINNCNIKQGHLIGLQPSNYINNIEKEPCFMNAKGEHIDIDANNYYIISDLRLKSCSPCIDKGIVNDSIFIPNIDWSNNPRVYNNDKIDLGAFEYQGNYACSELQIIFKNFKNNGLTYRFSLNNNYINDDSILILGDGVFKFKNISKDDEIIYNFTTLSGISIQGKVNNIRKDTTVVISIFDPATYVPIELKVYPSPTFDKITIDYMMENGKLIISDIKGNVIVNDDIYSVKKEYDVKNWSSGVYLIKYLTRDEAYFHKFIKL